MRTRHQQDNNVASQAGWLTRIFSVIAKQYQTKHYSTSSFQPSKECLLQLASRQLL